MSNTLLATSEETSRNLQEITEGKVQSAGTTSDAFAIERTVCITEIKMRHQQKAESAWVLEAKTKAQCYTTTTTKPPKRTAHTKP